MNEYIVKLTFNENKLPIMGAENTVYGENPFIALEKAIKYHELERSEIKEFSVEIKGFYPEIN